MDVDFKNKPIHPKTLKESHELIALLWEMGADLIEKQNTNFKNSFMPPSSDKHKNTGKNTDKKNCF